MGLKRALGLGDRGGIVGLRSPAGDYDRAVRPNSRHSLHAGRRHLIDRKGSLFEAKQSSGIDLIAISIDGRYVVGRSAHGQTGPALLISLPGLGKLLILKGHEVVER